MPTNGNDNRLKLLDDFKPLFSKEEFSKIVKKS